MARLPGLRWLLIAACLSSLLSSACGFIEPCRGRLIDAQSGQPISGAIVTAGSTVVFTDGRGFSQITGANESVGVRAVGYCHTLAA